VLKLVEVFDVSVFEKLNYRFYTLENINAEEAVKLLREVLSLYAGGGKDDVKFIPINRLNTLLIVSSGPDIFGRVDAVIRQLDVPSESAQPQIYIYSVKNGMATELGDILRSIFGRERTQKGARGVCPRSIRQGLPGRAARLQDNPPLHRHIAGRTTSIIRKRHRKRAPRLPCGEI
jgi:general secretion pathway protein D